MAEAPCARCGERVGYDVRFYQDGDGLVHARCVEKIGAAEAGDWLASLRKLSGADRAEAPTMACGHVADGYSIEGWLCVACWFGGDPVRAVAATICGDEIGGGS